MRRTTSLSVCCDTPSSLAFPPLEGLPQTASMAAASDSTIAGGRSCCAKQQALTDLPTCETDGRSYRSRATQLTFRLQLTRQPSGPRRASVRPRAGDRRRVLGEGPGPGAARGARARAGQHPPAQPAWQQAAALVRRPALRARSASWALSGRRALKLEGRGCWHYNPTTTTQSFRFASALPAHLRNGRVAAAPGRVASDHALVLFATRLLVRYIADFDPLTIRSRSSMLGWIR
jgi:hypothetical protein